MTISMVRQITWRDSLHFWWADYGALYHDLAVYYTVCAMLGFWCGYAQSQFLLGLVR